MKKGYDLLKILIYKEDLKLHFLLHGTLETCKLIVDQQPHPLLKTKKKKKKKKQAVYFTRENGNLQDIHTENIFHLNPCKV